MINSCLKFIKKETVLSVSFILAIISCFFVLPDQKYWNYFDFRTLALLFSLMVVMAGFREQGVFFNLGKRMLLKAKAMKQVVFILVLLCFFGSMIITNDVALITFVPFTFVVMDLLGEKVRHEWILPIVCMQTIAANLGSMFTPIGNPQNLYLYGKSGLDLKNFMKLMFPYVAVTFLLLIIWIFVLDIRKKTVNQKKLELEMNVEVKTNSGRVLLYSILFALCLLTVMHILPFPILLGIVFVTVLCSDRSVLAKVDYSLLFTFVGFFIFIGNLGRIDAFSYWLKEVLSGREVLVSVLASQIISNVPAALLLSGFTEQIPKLIIGTNLGGLGTLIASMASLISFRQIAKGEADRKGQYFILFTVSNILILIILFIVYKGIM